jgi:predicted ATPase
VAAETQSGKAELKSSGSPPARIGVFARSGDYWEIGLGAARFPIKDIKGLGYIQRLLQYPSKEFHALDLLGVSQKSIVASNTLVGPEEALPVGITIRRGLSGDSGEMLDAQSKREYKRRLDELNEMLEDQRERGNHERADQIEEEVEILTHVMQRAVGIGGRDRRAGSNAERARLNITRAIKTAIQSISEQNAPLGELLDRSIRTGAFCSYLPDVESPVAWQFSIEGGGLFASTPRVESTLLYPRELDPVAYRHDRTAFVGRDAEQSALHGILERVCGGVGSVVMVAGAPGVGKTRIITEFCRRAVDKGTYTLAGACYDRDDAVPFVPFVEMFESALSRTPDLLTFRNALGDEAPEIARLVPHLRRLFQDLPPSLDLPPDRTRRMLFSAVAQALWRVAGGLPLLLVLDDLQWADEGTLSLLSHLARTFAQQPVFIVGTYRDNELNLGGLLGKTLDDLIRAQLLSRLTLGGLSEVAVGEMIEALSGRKAPAQLVKLLFEETEGNPFFVEELFRHLRERGTLFDKNGDFRGNLTPDDIDIPESLHIVIGRRVARLDASTREMLCAAAVHGPSFAFDALQNSMSIDEDLLLDNVEEAQRAGLIAGSGQHADARFRFSHELVRQTILAGISQPRRQRLHIRVAQAIEHTYGVEAEDHAADLAHHLWRAGRAADPSKTIRYLAIAAKQAVTSSASKEAIGHLTRELQLLKGLPHDAERDRQELEAQASLGVALQNVKGYGASDVEQTYARAKALAEELGDTAQLISILRGKAYFHGVRAEYVKALELGREILRIGQQKPEYLVEGELTLGLQSLYLGNIGASRKHLERAIGSETAEQKAPRMVQYMGHSKATCLSYLARTLWLLGYPDQALQRSREALALAESMSLPITQAQAQGMHSLLYQVRRELALADEWCDRTIVYANEHGFAYWLALCSIMKVWLVGQAGQGETALNQFSAGLEQYRGTGAKLGLSWLLTLLAELSARVGQIEKGLRAIDDAHDHIRATGERYYEAESFRLKGELLIKAGENRLLADAETCFMTSLEIARSQGAKSWELKTVTSLARLWRDQHSKSKARRLLASTYGWFTEGFDTPDLRDAKQLLEELTRSG